MATHLSYKKYTEKVNCETQQTETRKKIKKKKNFAYQHLRHLPGGVFLSMFI